MMKPTLSAGTYGPDGIVVALRYSRTVIDNSSEPGDFFLTPDEARALARGLARAAKRAEANDARGWRAEQDRLIEAARSADK